jgi:hypothetical protein
MRRSLLLLGLCGSLALAPILPVEASRDAGAPAGGVVLSSFDGAHFLQTGPRARGWRGGQDRLAPRSQPSETGGRIEIPDFGSPDPGL